MKLSLTTLCENTVGGGNVIGEFGWSVFIRASDLNILFDTGRSISVCHNSGVLGVDLRQIDKIVLSHCHHDHTGGLRDILQRVQREIEIVGHPHLCSNRYNHRNKKYEFSGIPFGRQELGLCHCTGFIAINQLAHELGASVFFNNTGSRLEYS